MCEVTTPPTIDLDDRSSGAHVLAHLRWLAAIAQEDAAEQPCISADQLRPAADDTGGAPSLWLYRCLRLLPIRRLFGRRLGAALEYEGGRLVADEFEVSSTDAALQMAAQFGLLSPSRVSWHGDELRVETQDCAVCRGLPDIGERMCHFEAGFISRILEKATRRRAETTETHCWANGDYCCSFQTKFGPQNSAPERATDVTLDSDPDPVRIMAALIGTAGHAMRLSNELRRKNLELALLATTDPLTGLLNRRAIVDKLTAEIERASRYGHALSVAVIDVDRFKSINDTYGHSVGDAVLVRVAKTLKRLTRDVDMVARHGGEEFIVLFPHLAMPEANKVMQRLCSAISDSPESPRISVSVGVVTSPPAEMDLDQLLSLADGAMYEAKRLGRNCVVAHTS